MDIILSEWVTPNMLNLSDFSKFQMAQSLSCALCQNGRCKAEMERIYVDLKRLAEDRSSEQMPLDGQWLSMLVESARRQFDVEQREIEKERNLKIQRQHDEPWRFKKSVDELDAVEMGYLAEECLMNSGLFPLSSCHCVSCLSYILIEIMVQNLKQSNFLLK